jgi:inner membrane protein
MDSLTQAVLGASVAGLCAPAGHRRKALLVGAALGTLPDMDVLIDYGDPVSNFTYHRGFSHSLFVLAPFSILLWLALRRWWAPVRAAPLRWLAAISLTLITHPLLDAHTVYGTQLWWPVAVPPTMWSTLFIIDPAYTLPLLLGVVAAAIWPAERGAAATLRAGLILSTLYIGWSWAAKQIVEENARDTLADMNLGSAPMFSVPTPFNTVLWRVVALTDDGYVEGFDSLLVDEGPMIFKTFRSDRVSLEAASDVRAVARLRWFTRDFLRATVDENGRLTLADLRMGQEPDYVFSHIVAEIGNPHWRPVPPEQVPFDASQRALDETWRRIFAP